MNILLLNLNTGKSWGWGGIESHSEILASALLKKGHKVIMGCWINGNVTLKSIDLNLPARRVRIINSGDLRAILQISRICLKEKVDLIIANHGREYWPAAVAAKLLGIKIVFIRHQVDRIRRTTRWLIANHVERVVAVSKAVQDTLLKSGVPSGKIDVIYNSVPMQKFNPVLINRTEVRKEFGFGGDDIVVGTVGKLHRGKGVFELLHAVNRRAREYPTIRLLFVGDGPERRELEEEAEALSLSDKVIFAGLRRDIERMYAAMDIFVLPSTCQEAFGMVLIEAMAMGKPVIGTAVGGIPEIIESEVNGILVPPEDELALSHAIGRYIEDGEFSRRVAFEGRKMVENRFSDKAMGDNFERVLKEIV